jgi:ribonuclease D
MNETIFVDNMKMLRDMCRALDACDWLAIDIEFIRERTYYARLALVQVAGPNQTFCVDPLAISDLSLLFALLEKSDVTKVFHAGFQDLECLFQIRKQIPYPLFDTQVAAALLGLGEQVGYGALVKQLLGVELDKSRARTDWMKRPLGSDQIRYAADDVRYLAALYPLMVEKLSDLNRLEWMADELAHLKDPKSYQSDPSSCWQRIRGAGKLNRKQLNVLKHLAGWREQQAMDRDKPRRWILSDDALVTLAAQQPTNQEALLSNRHVNQKVANRHADALLGLIAAAKQEPEGCWPAHLQLRRPNPAEEATLDMLMAVVRLRAEAHQLSPGQITSRFELLKLVRGEDDLPLLGGWRHKVAGQAVYETYAGNLYLACKQGRATLMESV